MELKKLCALNGPSGYEDSVREFIIDRVKEYADEVNVDRMGNVYAFKRGTDKTPRHVLLSAHMDEVGFIITGINDNGLLSYEPIGGIDQRVVVSKQVSIGNNKIPGVIGSKAIHLQSAEELNRVLKHSELYIDIGAKDKACAEKLVKPGDYASFKSDWVEFGDNLVKAKALDDRIGVMILMSLLYSSYPCDITCVFTVQEEVGLRGARCAAFNVNPDVAIILEATSANDLGTEEPHLRICELGKGVAISFMDMSSFAHRGLFERLKNLAEDNNINWQLKRYISGGNDAGAYQNTSGALPTAVISVPCRYIHSPSCVANFSDIEAQFLLTEAFLNAGGKL